MLTEQTRPDMLTEERLVKNRIIWTKKQFVTNKLLEDLVKIYNVMNSSNYI